MNRHQPHRFGALLLGHGLDLPCADELLISDEADEALEIAAAELLVGPGQPRELPEVRVPPPAVPAREHREVVVVLGDDTVAQMLETGSHREPGETLVALPEGRQPAPVALRQALR